MMNNPYNQYNQMQNPYTNSPYYANRANPAAFNQNNRIIWVNGIEGAKAYQIEPNSNILLLDSDIDGRMYIKTCDNIGMCNLRVFAYQELQPNAPTSPQIDTTQFVTKEEMEQAINQAMQLLRSAQPKTEKKGVKSNE